MTVPEATSTGSALLEKLLSGVMTESEMAVLFAQFVELPVTADLLCDCAAVLRSKMVSVELPGGAKAIDTCGTGGSGKKTVNTSTLTALIVAAAGGKVAKHGNRSASGNCGCFDLLEKLGVRIDLTPESEIKIFQEMGLVFLFAPLHHPALKLVAPYRKAYGKKTIFNLFGPLCNPAGITRQLIGTGNDAHARLIAETLFRLQSFGSKVVTGNDGLDEVTSTADTVINAIDASGVHTSVFSPSEIPVPLSSEADIEGGTPEENVKIFLELIEGTGQQHKKNLVLLNAAHALVLAGMAPNVRDGYVLAKETLESGKVHALFMRYKEFSLKL